MYVRRTEEGEKRQDERQRRQMRIMVAAIQEGQRKTFPKRNEVSGSRGREVAGRGERDREMVCYYCEKNGHMRRECK